MNAELILRPDAENDLREAYNWYEKQNKGLGLEFILCVEACLETIQRHPDLYPAVRKEIHRALIRRFPYCVFYVIGEENIEVLAILHGRRHPKTWQERV